MDLKDRLKPVTYTRAFTAGRSIPVLLIGDSRWIKDIELLLEDRWSNLAIATEEEDIGPQMARTNPKLAVMEMGAWNGSELKVIEGVLPKSLKKILVTSAAAPNDELKWKRTTRRLASLNVPSAILDPSAKVAAEDLCDLLDSMVNSEALDLGEDFNRVHSAFGGFQLGASHDQPPLLLVLKKLLGQFALDYDVVSAACLLGETYSLWKKPKGADTELHMSYRRLEGIVSSTPAQSCLRVFEALVEHRRTGNNLSLEHWQAFLSAAGIGRLAERKLRTLYTEINSIYTSEKKIVLKVA